MIERTRRWVMRDLRGDGRGEDQGIRKAAAALFDRFGESKIEQWTNETWESFTLHLLWHICHRACTAFAASPDAGAAGPASRLVAAGHGN